MFPSNPNVGDRVTLSDGRIFEWNGTRWALVVSGGGPGSTEQTPWLSDIDADEYELINVARIGVEMTPVYSVDVIGDVNVTGIYRKGGQPLATGGDVTSIFGRTGAVDAEDDDYTAAQITDAVDASETYDDPAWINTLAWSKITGAPTPGVGVIVSGTPPVSPAEGVLWFDTASRRLLLRVEGHWINVANPTATGSVWDGALTTWDGGASIWDQGVIYYAFEH